MTVALGKFTKDEKFLWMTGYGGNNFMFVGIQSIALSLCLFQVSALVNTRRFYWKKSTETFNTNSFAISM